MREEEHSLLSDFDKIFTSSYLPLQASLETSFYVYKELGEHYPWRTMYPLTSVRSFCCMAVPWLPLGAPLEGSWGTATRHGGVSCLGCHESVAKYRTLAPFTCSLSKCSSALKQWKLLSRIWQHFQQMSSEETHKLLPGTAACSRQGWATRGGQVQLDLFFLQCWLIIVFLWANLKF